MVFDASALLAWLQDEPGSDVVERALDHGGWISAANWSEIAQKTGRRGAWIASKDLLLSFGLLVEPVSRDDAEAAAALWDRAQHLSLADRLCLALGRRLETEILTADRVWADQPGVLLIR